MFVRHGLIVRLMIPIALMVALVIGVLVMSHRAGQTVREADAAVIAAQRHALQLGELRSVSRALQRDALNLVTERNAEELTAIRARFDRRIGQFERDLSDLKRNPNTESQAEFARYTGAQRLVLSRLQDVARIATLDRSDALRHFARSVRPNERHASKIADRLIDRVARHQAGLVARAETIGKQQEQRLFLVSALFSIAAIALALVAILFTVIRPLNAIQEAMEALAAGDAKRPVPETRRTDAIGTMARAIEVFRIAAGERDRLRDLHEVERSAAADARYRESAGHAQREALEVQRRDLLSSLADAVEESLSAVNGKLRASATRLNRSADEVARYAAAAGLEAEATGRSAEDVTQELAATSAATGQLAHNAAGLRSTAIQATEAVRTAALRSRDAATRVAGMSAYADRVEELTELIGTVARQSQLLALNATIEAARAGTAGKGFGVVAHEMKRLSAQTASAAQNVEAEMTAIRSAARAGRTAIDEIAGAMEQIEQNAGLIVTAMLEQGAAHGEVSRGVSSALDSVGAVGARMAALGTTALGTRDVAEQLLHDAEALSDDAASVDTALRELVTRLRTA